MKWTIKINRNTPLLSATNPAGKGDEDTWLRNVQAIDQPKSCINKNWVKEQKWNGALLKRLLLTRAEMEAIEDKTTWERGYNQ